MSAKDTSNMAATAKRSATAIQHLAKVLGLDLAERNTIYAAAEILLKHGNCAKNKALGEKRVEQARERAQAKARAEATAIIATWPQTTTLDRVALIHATSFGAERLARGEDRDDPEWEMQYSTREAIEDVVRDAVMHAVPYSTSTVAVPVKDTMARVRALMEQIRMRPGIVTLAERWGARMQVVA